MTDAQATIVVSDGVALAVYESGPRHGQPVVLMHGLAATHRYVVMGSDYLERTRHRVIAYDARGHGVSRPANRPDEYTYAEMERDLEAVLDAFEVPRALLAGVSMGGQAALRFALRCPERVDGVVMITPGFHPVHSFKQDVLDRWDAMAAGLVAHGPPGFIEGGRFHELTCKHAPAIRRLIAQRVARHRYPEAVADALRTLTRSLPFGRIEDLADVAAPTAVIGSRDEFDPEHPLFVAEAYARALPDCTLHVEPEGERPLAWNGRKVSRVIAGLLGGVPDEEPVVGAARP